MLSSNTSAVSGDTTYIEDVCSVYLRTGTGSSQTVTTGVKENTGALVISKSRSAATDWAWYDTFRGATYDLVSNSTAAQTTQAQGLTSFNVDGHTWGTLAKVNTNGATYVDTVLKPTPKFFDVVTYTYTGSGQQVAHSLGGAVGAVIAKRLDASQDWLGWFKRTGYTTGVQLSLNTTEGPSGSSADSNFTDTYFTPNGVRGSNAGGTVAPVVGGTYVAYIFAHDAGGFGLTGTDNVISCGSFTTNVSGVGAVTLGYEPQWLMIKRTDSADDWMMFDTMRGFVSGPAVDTSDDAQLNANSSAAESIQSRGRPNATGFEAYTGSSSATYIYIAIRRGPMKVPTDGTKVFNITQANFVGGGTYGAFCTAGFLDTILWKNGQGSTSPFWFVDRLRGAAQINSGGTTPYLSTTSTAAEGSAPSQNSAGSLQPRSTFLDNNSFGGSASGDGGFGWLVYGLQRAPNFFDEVCYTGTGVAQNLTHNLGAAPEMILTKTRNVAQGWNVYHAAVGNTKAMVLNTTAAPTTATSFWNDTSPTSTVFTVGTANGTNNSGSTYVAYLFATCAGVSKVGSYTGTGTTQQINCGFAAGARFVLIKRTDSTGDWYVWDTARGIVSGNDPYLLLNSTAAEVTTTDYIDTYSAGFELSSTAPAALNASGGTYIFLAIA